MEPHLPVPAAPVHVRSDPTFDRLIGRLDNLSRNHLLYFRLEVGRAVAEELFDGDADAFRDTDRTKETSLREFARSHSDRLADLGLTESLLRMSIHAWHVVQGLPVELLPRLVFSHVVELARVEDGATRKLLAQAAVDNEWGGKELRGAVLAARAGEWIDADPEKPGLQPKLERLDPEPRLPPARIVTRVEKQVGQFADVASLWDDVPVASLTDLQRTRMAKALTDLDARIAAMRQRLAVGI